jgi:alpha-L-fucosidase
MRRRKTIPTTIYNDAGDITPDPICCQRSSAASVQIDPLEVALDAHLFREFKIAQELEQSDVRSQNIGKERRDSARSSATDQPPHHLHPTRDRADKSIGKLNAALAEVVSPKGYFLLNVGPAPESEIPPEFTSQLRVIGDWVGRIGEAIISAKPGGGLAPGAFYGTSTRSDDTIYLGELKVAGANFRSKDASLLGAIG